MAVAAGLAAIVAIVLLASGGSGGSGGGSGGSGPGSGTELAAGDVAKVGEAPIARTELEHWRDIRVKDAKSRRKPADEQQARKAAMKFLVEAEWLEQEAKSRGVTTTQAAVDKQFERDKRKSFPNEADYREFLRTSGQTDADIQYRVRLNLLTEGIQRDVLEGVSGRARQQKAIDEFTRDYERRYRAITLCRAGYIVSSCRNGPRPKPSGRSESR